MARGSRRAETRIGHEARAAATGTLDIALREGRLDLAEYERRLVVIQAARFSDDLTPAVADLPSRVGQRGPGLRISTADREQALVRLTEALTDGRLEATEYAVAEDRLQRAVTYADLDAIVGNLDTRASLIERDQAIERIEAAVADGLLDPAERHGRVEAARNATTDAQLAALVADLATGSGTLSKRASNADREAVAARLQDAVEGGFLDVTEFDERVRAVYAARLSSELTRLVADLPKPARSIPTPPPVEEQPVEKKFRREWGPNAFNVIFYYSFFGLTGVPIIAGGLGAVIGALALLIPGAWLIGLVPVVRSQRRLVAVEPSVGQPKKLAGHKRPAWALACLVLPDGTPVAISGSQDNTAMVWDLATNSLSHTLSGHTNDVVGVAAMVLPDGVPVAVTVSADRTVRMWDLRDGSQCGTLPGLTGEPRAVACLMLDTGTPAAIALSSDSIRMWDLQDLNVLRSFEYDDAVFEAIVPVALPDSEPVMVLWPRSTDHGLAISSVDNAEVQHMLFGHTDCPTAIDATVLPDGTPVAVSASLDKTIRVWDVRQGTLLRTITGMIFARQDLLCSSLPDGTPIVVGATLEDDTRVWDLRDGTELGTVSLRGGPLASVTLPDRTLLVGTVSDGSVVAVYPLTFR